jgi:hypothetical protein
MTEDQIRQLSNDELYRLHSVASPGTVAHGQYAGEIKRRIDLRSIDAEKRSLKRSNIALVIAAVSAVISFASYFKPNIAAPSPVVSSSRRAELLREKESVAYEASLVQVDLSKMDEGVRKPGVIGVSPEWQRHHAELQDKIRSLQVRIHEIDTELAALTH